MKRLRLLFGLLVVSVLLPAPVSAQNVNNFKINEFSADYYLNKDEDDHSYMYVEEKIVAAFPSYDQNHGIERSIPQTYDGYDLRLEITKVVDGNGAPYQYLTYERDNHTVVRIGDPATYARGITEYNIHYTVHNVITFYETHDEFFWDVNGTDWSQPMSLVKATVHMERAVAEERNPNEVCFTGEFGESKRDCTIDAGFDAVSVASTTGLGPEENLSLALRFNSGTFAPNYWDKAKYYLLFAIPLSIPLVTALYMGSRWWKFGRDAEGRDVIVPQYTPPDGLGVMQASAIVHEKLRPQDVTAGIISLAVKGYIQITEVVEDKMINDSYDYSLDLVRNTSVLSEPERRIVSKIFATEDPATAGRISLKLEKNTFAKKFRSLQKSMSKELTHEGYFKVDPMHARIRYSWLAVVFAILFIASVILGGAVSGSFVLVSIASIVVSGAITVLFSAIMPAKTSKGVRVKEYVEGMEDYIKLAEVDRLKYLESPEGARRYGDPTEEGTKIKLFETLLPYAVALGLEKDWANEFKDLYKEPPEWMNTNNPRFNSLALAQSLSSFNTANQQMFTPSSNSGASGGSGFGGGGFSGGGGGGGGGGGW